MSQQHGHQAQRVDVVASRAADLRIDPLQFREVPALDRFGFDRRPREFPLHRDVLEHSHRVVVERLLEESREQQHLGELTNPEWRRGTADTVQRANERHAVGREAERAQKSRGSDFRRNLGRSAVLDLDDLTAGELAVELGSRSFDRFGNEPARERGVSVETADRPRHGA